MPWLHKVPATSTGSQVCVLLLAEVACKLALVTEKHSQRTIMTHSKSSADCNIPYKATCYFSDIVQQAANMETGFLIGFGELCTNASPVGVTWYVKSINFTRLRFKSLLHTSKVNWFDKVLAHRANRVNMLV